MQQTFACHSSRRDCPGDLSCLGPEHPVQQRRGHSALGFDQLRLRRAGTQKLDASGLQVIDSSMDLQLAARNLLTDGLAVLHEEIHGMEDVELHRECCDFLLCRLGTSFRHCLGHHGVQALQKYIQGIVGLRRLLLGRKVCCRRPLDGTAVGMSQHKDQLGVEGPGAELQAAQDTSLSVCAGVSSVTQNEQITRKSIEECLQRTTRIRAAHDGRVGRLTFGCQSLAHAAMHLSSSRNARHEALVSLFQGLQGQLGRHDSILRCADGTKGHGWWQRQIRRQQLRLAWGLTQKLHSASLEVIDATLDVQLSLADQLTQWLTELQQEIHGMEDVHLHSMRHQLLLGSTWAQLFTGILRHHGKTLQQALQSAARSIGGSCLVGRSGPSNGTTLGVSQDQNQLAA
mmetsp:Transcript_36404/g.78595  ORF Transcript_36404/g.78595 Transcript_36404/m.78595 type:complete len:400 (+) Transcript_36404:463-1662(+)